MKLFRRLRRVFADYGELIANLAVKNLKVQYKHAALGFLWSLFMPLALMLVFWFIFGFLFNRGVGPLFLICALFPWTFIQMSISSATTSIVDSRDIIRKVYFPREIIPFSIVASNCFNFVIALLLIVIGVVVKRIWAGETGMITISYLSLPLLLGLTVMLAAGVGLLTSCGQVYFRDVRYLVEIGLLIWFYLSPVFYPIAIVKQYSNTVFLIYMLNPVAALITLYRGVFQIGDPYSAYISPSYLIGTTTAVILIIFIVGYRLFIWKEREFVDLV
ncbi:MAG: ABC transporter permease [Candidatus Aureabacteria bacterium]|nr:ABC transporter permease [Candidatus Auribacterota bacterium]